MIEVELNKYVVLCGLLCNKVVEVTCVVKFDSFKFV